MESSIGTKTPFKIDTGADFSGNLQEVEESKTLPVLAKSVIAWRKSEYLRGIHGSDNIQRTEIFFQNSGG